MPSSSSTLGSYAKVLALNQGMINKGLGDLFNAYQTQLKRLSYKDDTLGNLTLDLYPPRILIRDEENVYFQLRIQYGSITSPSLPTPVNLEGWTITHKLQKNDLLAFAGEASAGNPGDLAIERIFATLVASANDGFLPDPELSIRESAEDLKNDRPLTWAEWGAQSPAEYECAVSVLQGFPKKYNAAKYNALGYRVKLPPPPDVRLTRLGIGLEREERRILDYVSAVGSKNEDTQAPGFNSILIAGLSPGSPGGQEPTFSAAVYSTNFVSQAMSQGATEVQTGFWTLNSRDLLETLVLPQLTVMNEASILKTAPPAWTAQPDGSKRYAPVINLGRDFDVPEDTGLPQQGYGFTKAIGGEGVPVFQWDTSINLPYNQTNDAQPASGRAHRYETSSSCSATVSWRQTEVRDLIKLDYVTTYKVVSSWANSAAWEKTIATAQYTFLLKYFFFIKFAFDNGHLRITLTSGPHETTTPTEGGFSLELVDEVSFGRCENYEMKYFILLEKYIKEHLFPSIKTASRKLQARFKKDMVFPIDPESSWMQLSTKPIFNVAGDLVVGIQYKPPQYSSTFLTAYVPRPPTPPPPPPKPPKPEPAPPTTKLTWTYTFSQDPDDEDTAVLRLVGTNRNPSSLAGPVHVGYLLVAFSSGAESSTSGPLFSASTIKTSDVEIVTAPCESRVTVSQTAGDKQRWEVRVAPEPGEDEEAEMAVFRVERGEGVEIVVQARCYAERWVQNPTTGEGTAMGEVVVKEGWKDEEDVRQYKGTGEMVVIVNV